MGGGEGEGGACAFLHWGMYTLTGAIHATFPHLCNRRVTGFPKGGEGFGLLLTTKTQCIRVHACNVFPLFMKFGGPPKGREAVLTPKTPPRWSSWRI